MVVPYLGQWRASNTTSHLSGGSFWMNRCAIASLSLFFLLSLSLYSCRYFTLRSFLNFSNIWCSNLSYIVTAVLNKHWKVMLYKVIYELPTLIVLCSNIFHSLYIIISGLDWCCLANFFLIRAGLWHSPSTGQLQQLSQQLLFVSSKLHKLFHKKYLKQRIYKFQTDSNDGFGTNTLFISILTHCEE